MEFYISFVHVY